MIPKKIKREINSKSKLTSVANLLDYINAPTHKNLEEKLLFSGTRGFVFDEFEIQKQEMLALVHSNKRSPNPVMHYLFSWKEGEQPTREQIEELIDIFIEETGLKNNQIMWGVHQNTKNIHLHIAVNKIDLDTEKITRINNNLDIEVLHKVVAKVEHKQGWESTPNARYTCDEEGNILRANNARLRPAIKQNVHDYEIASGEKSAIRIAQETILDLIKNSQSWNELHAKLDEVGMTYQKKGTGAVINVNNVFVKASSVSRDFSLKRMEQKLGTYEESSYLQPKLDIEVQSINFLTMENMHGKSRCNSAEPRSRNKQPCAEEVGRIPSTRMFPMSTCPMVRRGTKIPIGTQQRRRRERNKKRKLEALLPNIRRACGAIDNFLRWDCPQYGGSTADKVGLELWFKYQQDKFKIYQDKTAYNIQKSFGMLIERKSFAIPKFIDWLKKYAPEKVDIWRYEREQNYITNDDSKERCRIHFFDTVENKLGELAKGGWEKISVHGNDFFKQLVMKLSFKHRFKITNPELQAILIKNETEYKNIESMNELQNFLAYHNAVQAERYRVTCIKIADDGTKKAFVLKDNFGDKQYQANGFTPEQLQERLKEMIKIQSKGNNIYLTPLSDNKHHILLDDMTREKLETFLMDGYQPATILESSPNNYQAIISIPKLGTQHDKDVGNRITERLNKQYGDKKLSGCIHPHRVPAFQNLKPKHRSIAPNGSITYPTVKLLQTEQIECPKAYRLSQQINAEHVVSAKQKNEKKIDYIRNNIEVPANMAYFRHLENIKNNLDIIDKSRVDAMIAVRMRATGHSQASIQETIKECAMQWREPNERKSWDDYAKRTAEYAFSYSGDREIEKNEKYHKHWLRIEGANEQLENSSPMKVKKRKLKA